MERKMIEKISEAYCKWEEHINLRFAYAARDEYADESFPRFVQRNLRAYARNE